MIRYRNLVCFPPPTYHVCIAPLVPATLFFHLRMHAEFVDSPATEKKVYNTHLIISASGDIEATYRKIHLFDVVSTVIAI